MVSSVGKSVAVVAALNPKLKTMDRQLIALVFEKASVMTKAYSFTFKATKHGVIATVLLDDGRRSEKSSKLNSGPPNLKEVHETQRNTPISSKQMGSTRAPQNTRDSSRSCSPQQPMAAPASAPAPAPAPAQKSTSSGSSASKSAWIDKNARSATSSSQKGATTATSTPSAAVQTAADGVFHFGAPPATPPNAKKATAKRMLTTSSSTSKPRPKAKALTEPQKLRREAYALELKELQRNAYAQGLGWQPGRAYPSSSSSSSSSPASAERSAMDDVEFPTLPPLPTLCAS